MMNVFLRYIIVVLVGILLLVGGEFFFNGGITRVFEVDRSGISYIILFWTVVTLTYGTKSVAEIEIDRYYRLTPEQLEAKYRAQFLYMRIFISNVVVLGLIGTVVGFMYAFGQVTPEEVANLESMPSTIVRLISGLGIAFSTTLVGAVASLWVTFIHYVLTRAVLQLIEKRTQA